MTNLVQTDIQSSENCAIATITLNNVARLNIMNTEMISEAIASLDALEADDGLLSPASAGGFPASTRKIEHGGLRAATGGPLGQGSRITSAAAPAAATRLATAAPTTSARRVPVPDRSRVQSTNVAK